MTQSAQKNPDQEDRLFYTFLMALICVPLAAWLLYSGYQKNQQSASKTAACEKRCTALGHAGYDFKWPMFSGPQCACIDMK
jgi:hypothetical protein